MNRFARKRARKRVSQGDVNLAQTTISRNDDLPDEWRENFTKDDDGVYQWSGSDEELGQVRKAMKTYEETEAAIGEDKSYYDARFNLQFLYDNS